MVMRRKFPGLRKVHGRKKPFFMFKGKKVFIKNKSRITDMGKKGRIIRVLSPISRKFIGNK